MKLLYYIPILLCVISGKWLQGAGASVESSASGVTGKFFSVDEILKRWGESSDWYRNLITKLKHSQCFSTTQCDDSANNFIKLFFDIHSPIARSSLTSEEFFEKNAEKYNDYIVQKLLLPSMYPEHIFFMIDLSNNAHSYVIEKQSDSKKTWYRIYQSWAMQYSLNQWLGIEPWPTLESQSIVKPWGLGKRLTLEQLTEFIQDLIANLSNHGGHKTFIRVYQLDPPFTGSAVRPSQAYLIAAQAVVPLAISKTAINSLFLYSVEQNDNDIAHYALEHGADVNVKNAHNNTALMIASSSNNSALIKLLLAQKKIDINALVDGHLSVLQYPIFACNQEIAALLLDSGVTIKKSLVKSFAPALDRCVSRTIKFIEEWQARHVELGLAAASADFFGLSSRSAESEAVDDLNRAINSGNTTNVKTVLSNGLSVTPKHIERATEHLQITKKQEENYREIVKILS